MKKIIIALILFVGLISFSVQAEARITSVRGYYKPSIGRYIMPYYKTTPNKTRFDNFSTKGNSNPFTGKKGYTSPFKLLKLR